MDLLVYLKDKLTPEEMYVAKKLYSEETKVFLETLERFRKHFQEELKVMNKDIFNGLGENE
jgi:hypothetical protein